MSIQANPAVRGKARRRSDPSLSVASTTSLADYIASNLDAIVANCEASLVSSVGIDGAAGHCAAILQHAVCRMRARGTPEPLPPTASEGSKPQPNGINDFLHRTRAVRASVTASWLVAAGGDPDAIQELLAFNDALDLLVMRAMDEHDRRVQENQDLFIGMLSHDVRTPLHAMMTSAAVIERRDDLPQGVRDVLRRITASGERIDRLARDLLEFARIRLGREMPLNLARCSF